MEYRHGSDLEFRSLTENGKAIYLELVERYGLPYAEIR